MKQKTVLTRRVIILAIITMLVAMVVQVGVYVSMNDSMAEALTRSEVLSHTQQLVSSANEPLLYTGSAAMLDALGGKAWLSDATGVRLVTNENVTLSPDLVTEINSLEPQQSIMRRLKIGGKAHMLCAIPVPTSSGGKSAVFAVALPLDYSTSGRAVAISFLSSFAAAALALFIGIHVLIRPTDKALASLHKVAINVADGNLSKVAPVNGPGYIGSIGTAINEISHQLSQSMYKLILERNRLKSMLDGLNEGIVAIDENGQITHTNPAMEKLYGQPRTSLMHLPDARLRLIPNPGIWEDFDHVVESGNMLTRNLEVRDRTVRLVISPIHDDLDKIAGAIGLFTDITEMERLERTRREYVSNVSHELRTPMTAIRALVEPLKEGMVTKEEDRQRYYSIILNEVMRLSRLINDQLELSRLQSGTLSIEKKKLHLDDIIFDVCERYSIIAEEKKLELKLDTDFSKCPTVYSNEDRVEQLLIILLDNAMKYTEKGSVSISGEWDSEKVTLTVRDTGVGINEKDLQYVFDRFYKVDKAHSGGGSGLGLSIAHEVVNRLEEKIWVESEPGKGTAFSFTLHRNEETKTEE